LKEAKINGLNIEYTGIKGKDIKKNKGKGEKRGGI